jgi:hypothetical protein
MYIEDTVNNNNIKKYASVAIVINNGHKIRKRDVYMDQLYHESTPTTTSFLEKTTNYDIWSCTTNTE